MKRWSPLITLLTGAVLGIALWIASMVATSPAPGGSGYGAAGSPPVSATPAATATSAAVPSSAASTAPESTALAASPTAPGGELEHANFAGMVSGGEAAIAISIRNGRAIAYFGNGKTIDAWLSGTMANGKLLLTGKRGARAEVSPRRARAGHGHGERHPARVLGGHGEQAGRAVPGHRGGERHPGQGGLDRLGQRREDRLA